MQPRVLVVYANPATTATPVAPYGAERVVHALRIAGCDARLVSPWLETRPGAALAAALDAFRPDLVGFSVRNVDDALIVRGEDGTTPIDTTFYLPKIRRLVRLVQARGTPILLGGAALATLPDGVMRYLGVAHAIVGPADDLVWRLGRALVGGTPFPQALPDDVRVRAVPMFARRIMGQGGHAPPATPPLEGAAIPAANHPTPAPSGRHASGVHVASIFRAVPGPTPRDPAWIVLARARNGRVPVALSTGCDRRCHFCVEASFLGGRVSPRAVDEIVHEIKLLRDAGVRRVWLAASELNVPDVRHATAVLRALRGLDVDVTGFLQPAPVDDALLDAFVDAGVDPSSLSWELGHLDDVLLRAGAGPANRASIDRLVDLYIRRGHAVLGGSMLLGAHPREDDASVDRALAAAREIDAALGGQAPPSAETRAPRGLGLAYAAGGRVYAAAPLGRWVEANLAQARPHLYGRITPGFVAPVVFCRPGAPRALLRRIREGLAGCGGPMAPLNGEAPASTAVLAAEHAVNRAILALHARDVGAAERALRAALRRAPEHPESLRQLALLRANFRGDRAGALVLLTRLRAVVGPEPEVDRAIAALS